MSQPRNRMERLVRLKQFREELADGRLRDALMAERRASEALDSAIERVEGIGAWKQRAGGGLDIAFYEAVLAAEAHAMEGSDAARRELDAAEGGSGQARAALAQAALGHRAARHRHDRIDAELRSADEKREFDQLSDLNAATWGVNP
jgi:hypothetical protein